MTEIYLLGTGGWVASRKRDNTSLLIHKGKDLVLIDCPGSVIQKIKKIGLLPENIVSLLVTHVHPDHIYGLPSLVHSLMLVDCAIDLYGKEETLDFCRKLLDLFRLREDTVKCRVNFSPLAPGDRFQPLSSLRGSCLDVPHHSTSLAYALEFEEEKTRLLYSGDTPLHLPLFQAARDFEYLVHECSAPKRYFDLYPVLYDIHTSAADLGRLSSEYGIKNLIPCHIFGDLDFSESEIERELRNRYSGNLHYLQDLDKVVF